VKRNVVALCDIPRGRPGRPSKALTLDPAQALLNAAEYTTPYAYIVLSLLIGARPEELRAPTWAHVDLKGKPDADPPYPRPSWCGIPSVRAGIPRPRSLGGRWRCRNAACTHTSSTRSAKPSQRRRPGRTGKAAGLEPEEWTPRELRHSFVSLSDSGVPVEDIARLVGHRGGSAVTETVYRKQLRPVLEKGATAMDRILAPDRLGA
jgi:integrase